MFSRAQRISPLKLNQTLSITKFRLNHITSETLLMKHNVYFDGKVQSLGVNTEEGYATVGVITPGKYTFAAEFEEHVVIIVGTLRVKLPGQEWRVVGRNEKYVIPPKTSFDIEAGKDVAYICYYK